MEEEKLSRVDVISFFVKSIERYLFQFTQKELHIKEPSTKFTIQRFNNMGTKIQLTLLMKQVVVRVFPKGEITISYYDNTTQTETRLEIAQTIKDGEYSQNQIIGLIFEAKSFVRHSLKDGRGY